MNVGITVLGSGSKGNAAVVQAGDEALLIDAGFSARELRRRMRASGVDEGKITAVVVSHEHTDHVKGVRVLSGQLGLPVYTNRRTAEVIRDRDARFGGVQIFAAGNPFDVGAFHVEPFSIPHDAYDPVAFVVRVNGLKLALATDLGHASQLVSYQLRECDALVLESNHDLDLLRVSRRPWSLKQRILSRHGHLSNDASLALLADVLHARTRHVVLAHASQECNRYEIVEEGVRDRLRTLSRDDVTVQVARQDAPTRTLWFD